MSYEYARAYALTGAAVFRDYYGDRGPMDAIYSPEIGERGFLYYDDAVTADAARDVDMAIRHTPLKIQQDIEAALTP